MKKKIFLAVCLLVFLLDFFARRRYTMFLDITPVRNGQAAATFVCPNNIFNTFVLKLDSTNTTLSSGISGKVSVFKYGVLVEERTFSKAAALRTQPDILKLWPRYFNDLSLAAAESSFSMNRRKAESHGRSAA